MRMLLRRMRVWIQRFRDSNQTQKQTQNPMSANKQHDKTKRITTEENKKKLLLYACKCMYVCMYVCTYVCIQGYVFIHVAVSPLPLFLNYFLRVLCKLGNACGETSTQIGKQLLDAVVRRLKSKNYLIYLHTCLLVRSHV